MCFRACLHVCMLTVSGQIENAHNDVICLEQLQKELGRLDFSENEPVRTS